MKMSETFRILMLGWEYPPKISGGLGSAIEGMANALAEKGIEVDILLPKVHSSHKPSPNVRLLDASKMKLKERQWTEEVEEIEEIRKMEFGKTFLPYLPPEIFAYEKKEKVVRKVKKVFKERQAADAIELSGEYGPGIFIQIKKYALLAQEIITSKHYSAVHAHDWMTFNAAALLQKTTDLPVIFHVHSIESSRNGIFGNEEVSSIEKGGLANAKKIVAVSQRLKNEIVNDYGVDHSKIAVIPNGLSSRMTSVRAGSNLKVGFVGRLTSQKGPSHFLDIAKELKSRLSNISFEIVGDGYLLPELKKKAHHLNLTNQITFTGFITPSEVTKHLKSFDLLIAPSESEPFGLVILEGIFAGLPVITSDNTGIAEFVPSLPQMPNWNTFELTRKCIEILSEEKTRIELVNQCQLEAKDLKWANTAKKLIKVFKAAS